MCFTAVISDNLFNWLIKIHEFTISQWIASHTNTHVHAHSDISPAAKWVPSINKAVLRVCALYAASCFGISPGGLKWFPCVQCLLREEGRVSTSVDTRL